MKKELCFFNQEDGTWVIRTVLEYNAVNDPIILIRLCGQAFNMTIIQAYTPTIDAERR